MQQFTIRAIRISCGYTVGEIADYFGIPQTRVRDVEEDSSDLDYNVLLKITDFFKVPPDMIYLGVTKR